jgi:hypothetical protein
MRTVILADLAGAECRRAGRDTPHIMPPTLASIYCGVHDGPIGRGGLGASVYAEGVKEGAFSHLITTSTDCRVKARSWPI